MLSNSFSKSLTVGTVSGSNSSISAGSMGTQTRPGPSALPSPWWNPAYQYQDAHRMEISVNDYDASKLQHRSWGTCIEGLNPELLGQSVARSSEVGEGYYREKPTPRNLSDLLSCPITFMTSVHFSSLSFSSDCHFPRNSPIVSADQN